MFGSILPGVPSKLALASLLLLLQVGGGRCANRWVDIWGSMPQLTEPANLPPAPFNQTGVVFQDATIRQTVRVGLDAPTIRLQISNAFGGADLPITAVTVALPANGSSGTSAVDAASLRPVTFSGGSPNFTIPNGALAVSDPLDFPVAALSVLTVTMYLATGQATNAITSHPGSRTTSFFAAGNQVSAADLADASVKHVEHWYFLSAVEGWLPDAAGTLSIVGDSIADGRGSTNNQNDRWPDALQGRLRDAAAANPVVVINVAAGGNRVLADGLGPNALGRIERDVLAHGAARYALVCVGVNDIGTAAPDAASQDAVAARLTAAYSQLVSRLHGRGIAALGATITPFCGAGQPYCSDGNSSASREATRLRVNDWIRDSGRFDAVVDFDAAVRNPANATQLRPDFNSGDSLHLNPAGYRAMAESVDLDLFVRFAGGVESMT